MRSMTLLTLVGALVLGSSMPASAQSVFFIACQEDGRRAWTYRVNQAEQNVQRWSSRDSVWQDYCRNMRSMNADCRVNNDEVFWLHSGSNWSIETRVSRIDGSMRVRTGSGEQRSGRCTPTDDPTGGQRAF